HEGAPRILGPLVQADQNRQPRGVTERELAEVEHHPTAVVGQIASGSFQPVARTDVELAADAHDIVADRLHRELGARVHRHSAPLVPAPRPAPHACCPYCTGRTRVSLHLTPETPIVSGPRGIHSHLASHPAIWLL